MIGARTIGGITAAIALSTAAAAAEPFDWTGTYEGFVVCDNIAGGIASTFGRPMTLAIAQSGDRIDARNTVDVDPSQDASYTVFRGRAIAGATGDWVSGYLEVCDSSFPHDEMIRIFPASTGAETFSFAADTVFVAEVVPGMGENLVVESCKWSLTRTSTERPSFESCP
jgi:hypothetical protein